MPQPDSSRRRDHPFPAREAAPWPIDPAAPQEPEKDARTPDDRDGNEELEREQKERPRPPARRRDRNAQAPARAVGSWESEDEEDTVRVVASEGLTPEDELDDTWPNLPPRLL